MRRASPLVADNDLSFEAWVRHVFDRPITRPEWYMEDYRDDWSPHPRVVLSHLTRLFEAPRPATADYSRPQLGEGFWFLASEIGSGYMQLLHDRRLPWPLRRRTLSSIPLLFDRLFAAECGDSLGHRDHAGDDLLAMTCYMWWHIFPTRPDPDVRPRPRFTAALLDAMSAILLLPSEACRESALHGLGHALPLSPERVEALVDGFLAGDPGISSELKAYALQAREGKVI